MTCKYVFSNNMPFSALELQIDKNSQMEIAVSVTFSIWNGALRGDFCQSYTSGLPVLIAFIAQVRKFSSQIFNEHLYRSQNRSKAENHFKGRLEELYSDDKNILSLCLLHELRSFLRVCTNYRQVSTFQERQTYCIKCSC